MSHSLGNTALSMLNVVKKIFIKYIKCNRYVKGVITPVCVYKEGFAE